MCSLLAATTPINFKTDYAEDLLVPFTRGLAATRGRSNEGKAVL